MTARRRKPRSTARRRRRSATTSLAAIRKEVLDTFVARATRPLTGSGQSALQDMFDLTIRKFKRSAAAKAPGLDVWTTKKGRFRTFILGEARKIARAASTDAGSGSIDATILNRAGLRTMVATNARCQIAIHQGKLILDTGQLHGPVCSAFLEQKVVQGS